MNNGGGFYPSPYKPTSFNGISNNFNLGPPAIPSYYGVGLQQSPQQYQNSQQRIIQQQNLENIPPTPAFKFYDLEGNQESEIVHLIFSYAGVTYKVKRFQQDEWKKAKEQMPFEILPILRVNNQLKIFQLHAITQYLAREFYLNGLGQTEHAIVDMVVETIRSLREKVFEQINQNPDDLEQKLRQVITDHAGNYLKQLEKYYEIFNRIGPFYLGSHISLADLLFYDTINHLVKFDKKLLENYPRLREARRILDKHPRLSNYHNAKNALKHHNEHKVHDPNTQSRHHKIKSPTSNEPIRKHHRHHSHDANEIQNHRNHHHHHHHHRRHHSKEPTPLPQKKHRSVRQSQSPNMITKEKEQISTHRGKHRSNRQSKSPNASIKDKELTPPSQNRKSSTRASNSSSSSAGVKESTPPLQPKQPTSRTARSPGSPTKNKESTPLRATDVIPPPPPIPPPSVPLPPPPPPVITEQRNQSTNH